MISQYKSQYIFNIYNKSIVNGVHGYQILAQPLVVEVPLLEHAQNKLTKEMAVPAKANQLKRKLVTTNYVQIF